MSCSNSRDRCNFFSNRKLDPWDEIAEGKNEAANKIKETIKASFEAKEDFAKITLSCTPDDEYWIKRLLKSKGYKVTTDMEDNCLFYKFQIQNIFQAWLYKMEGD